MQLVASGGDVRLTAERSGLAVSDLTAMLLEDPQKLQDAIRSSMSLQLLDVLANLRVALVAALGEMSPKEMISLMSSLLGGFNELWAEGAQQTNLINFPVVNGDISSARDKLQSRIAQLATAAEGN